MNVEYSDDSNIKTKLLRIRRQNSGVSGLSSLSLGMRWVDERAVMRLRKGIRENDL